MSRKEKEVLNACFLKKSSISYGKYFFSQIKKLICGERGFSLLELLVSLPIVMLLLISLITAFFFSIKAYMYEISDWVLQDEIRTVMCQIVHDLKYAKTVEKNADVLYIKLHENTNLKRKFIIYERLDKMLHPMARGKQPMTGHSKLSSVDIKKFSFRIEDRGDNPQVVHLELVGENLMTKHVFALETSVQLKRMK